MCNADILACRRVFHIKVKALLIISPLYGYDFDIRPGKKSKHRLGNTSI